MRGRLAALLLVLGMAALVGMFAGLYFFSGRTGGGGAPVLQATPTLVVQIQSLSQLVSVKYVLQKVVILEDIKWYGENRVLFVAHGIVKAGVDLRKLQPGDIDVRGKHVTLRLPAAEITDAYLDDQRSQVVERTTGLLRAFDKDLEQGARRQAVDDLQRTARYSGILKEADERARDQLGLFLGSLGFEVEFR